MWIILTVLLYLIGSILTLGILLAVGLIVHARWNYGSLEKLGIPVVKPHFCLGSNPNGHKEKANLVDVERSKTYGSVYGVYEGREPAIYVSDPELLRIIQSRDFEHFRNHRPSFGGDHPIWEELTDFLDDEKWKTVRAALTPHFSSGKLKGMAETISQIAQDYVTALIQDNPGKSKIKMDVRSYVPPLILEIIGRCFCGINIQNARDPENKFIQTLKLAMGGDFVWDSDWTYSAKNAFPILAKLSPVFPNTLLQTFDDTFRGILQARSASGTKLPDMVHTLLEIFEKSRTDPTYQKLGITEVTAIAQGFEFFLASYEGLRSNFTLLSYHLATCPEIQDRVLDEIDRALEEHGGKVSSETVAAMPLLTACIGETLRLRPSFFRLDRRCTKDWAHNGLRIQKGMGLVIPLWALHRDPDQFPEPELWDPDRFLPGRKERIHPYAVNSFGQGPRACIGQRFSYEMIKIVLVHYLKEFRIERRGDTVFRDRVNPFALTYDTILVDFVRRG